MRRFLEILHHRSLTVSIVCLLFAAYALAFLPEHASRFQQGGTPLVTLAAVAAGLGLLCCALTLVVLLRDNRSGYPAFRCSLATLLWALAWVPILALTCVVIREIWK
jgi:amino acid transporter